jgi:carboxylate-amine ligase
MTDTTSPPSRASAARHPDAHAYTIGIEEEFFLSDAVTRDAPAQRPDRFMTAAKTLLPQAVRAEMLQSQIEVATRPHRGLDGAREELAGYRRHLGLLAGEHGLSLAAVGTHPLMLWTEQRATSQPRYGRLMHDLQMLGARNMVCGLHVHVEVPDPDARVDLMRRVLPFIPLLLALSTSSPFWQARRTGLMGYRLAAYDELPRTGLPELFDGKEAYDRYVDTLVAARAIPDASYIWWAIRPSLSHPTLELRVADSCTRLDDVLAIAALYRAIVRHLVRNPSLNAGIDAAERAVVLENKWRAQRYGIHGAFIDSTTGTMRTLEAWLDETIAMVFGDLVALGHAEVMVDLRRILREGTSADRQVALYTEARGRGLSPETALADVVDWLAATTTGAVVPAPLDMPFVGTVH